MAHRHILYVFIISVVLIIVVISFIPEQVPEHFVLDATYYNNTVHVSFTDHSEGTQSVTMEILGMNPTLQRTYDGPFEDVINFGSKPRYGWEAHPVILYLDHQDMGMITLKTEIHEPNSTLPRIIFSRP